ncbi:MAG: ribosome biogenesis GTPase YlqF [Firmicutes bacterium]|nr:ribosome biogenesis GTPase YlqF [Bacillota bacterium]
MNKINWFPGHMKKALEEMQAEVKNVDAVIYVLDARAPKACLNPSFVKIIGNKPILFVLNKCDLADEQKVKEFAQNLISENSKCLLLNSTASGALNKVTNALNELCKNQIERFKNKGVNYYVRAMVLGVPNSGKSTLVNNLCGSARAVTGNKPGVTKGKQWVKLSNNIEILDTPGTLWPNLEVEETALRLAYIGSIKDDVLQIEELVLQLIEDLKKLYPELLKEKYKIDDVENKLPLEIFEEIAEMKKCLLKGGEIDYEHAAKAILDDFRKCRIGKITF